MHIVVSITNKLCEEPVTNYPHLERRCSGTIAIWTGYVAYAGLLIQVLLRYPVSLDTFFAGGLIAIAVCANHTFLFSCMWDSIKRKSLGQNLDLADSMNKYNIGDFRKHGGQQGSEWNSTLACCRAKAQHIVNTARNAKMARLRQAKEEAEKEIAEFRAHMEAEFQRKLTESSGDSGANVKRLEHETEAKIGHLRQKPQGSPMMLYRCF
ncbi:hypothetical protein NC651_019629 [Populus alba x Populus x berolinensis]|nr:hypothetical protein NC651_019629 [Populus alba x Populus x berolinensis]